MRGRTFERIQGIRKEKKINKTKTNKRIGKIEGTVVNSE